MGWIARIHRIATADGHFEGDCDGRLSLGLIANAAAFGASDFFGHEVLIVNSRGPASLADPARETGAKPAPLAEAVRTGEVVPVTIPAAKI